MSAVLLAVAVLLLAGPDDSNWRYPVRIEGQAAIINSSGRIVGDGRYDEVRSFFRLGAARQGDRWGYVDRDGEWAIAPEYLEADDFSDGRARVRTPSGWILIDASGRPVTERPYPAMTALSDGVATFQADEAVRAPGKPGKWGFLSRSGRELTPAVFDGAGGLHGENRVPVPKYRKLLFLKIERRWGYADSAGVWRIDPAFVSVRGFSEGKALVSDGRQARFLDLQGDTLLTVDYPQVHSFSEGLARVGRDGLWGFIDAQGSDRIPLKYEAAADFSEGLARVRMGGRWGYIDADGRTVIEHRFSVAGSFMGPLARVVTDAGEAWIDRSGVVVWPAGSR